MTLRRILDVLRAQGPCSRAELVRGTGISAPTISKAVASMIESKVIEDGERPTGGLGRPGRRLQLARRGAQVIGLVLDAHECQLVAAGVDGVFHESTRRIIAVPDDYETLLDSIVDAAVPLIERGGVATLRLGISTPGLMDRSEQRVILSPNLPITNDRCPARDLGDRLGVDAVMIQESHALCLAERTYGRARGVDHFAMVDATIGLGLGVMQGGELVLGHRGFAGELGHITVEPEGRLCGCGNRGCLETLATDSALAAAVGERHATAADTESILSHIGTGRLAADAEVRRTTTYLSMALSAVINLFNPEAVFVLSHWLDLDDALFPRLVEATRRRALDPSHRECRIERAEATKIEGAVAGALHHLVDVLKPAS